MSNYATDADIRRLKAKGERPELISLSRRDEVPHGGATLCVRVYPILQLLHELSAQLGQQFGHLGVNDMFLVPSQRNL